MADIKHMVQIPASPETVFELCATAEGFRQWWSVDVVESDGVVALGFFNRATIYRLRPQSAMPGVEVDWVCESGDEWSGTHINFKLAPVKSGTVLRFTHAGWRAETDYFCSCNTTWGELMYRLKAAARGSNPGPLFLANDMAY